MAAAMIDDEFKYVLDENGDRVLVGLTASETAEFERLNLLRCSEDNELPYILSDRELQASREQRWLELFEKHELARWALIEAHRSTKH